MDLVEDILGGPFIPDERKGPDRKDRVRGMLFGVALGDALGGPHEFRYQVPLGKYHGIVEHPLEYIPRYQRRLVGNVGQITDDTEMTITLADSILLNDCYDRETTTMAYMAWANSGMRLMGTNTRSLFANIKTFKGFESRLRAKRAAPQDEWTQSNGCLMRCTPLAVLPEDKWFTAAVMDCGTTNPHPVCVDGVLAYLTAARALLAGKTPEEATQLAADNATTDKIANVISMGRDGIELDVSRRATKGWIVFAIYCAFKALNDTAETYQDRIDAIIRLGGDTDTNAAIAGGLVGAYLGAAKMREEDRTCTNLAVVLTCDPAAGDMPRAEKYGAQRLPTIADALAEI